MADLKRSTKLFMDETRAPVLDPGARKTKTGYFWALARDDRPWGGTSPPAVVFTYAPGRGGQHAERILQGFGGILQVDGYAGYNRLAVSHAHRHRPRAQAEPDRKPASLELRCHGVIWTPLTKRKKVAT